MSIFPNHTRSFFGPEAAAPPPDVEQLPDVPPEIVQRIPERQPYPPFKMRRFLDSVGSSPGAGTVIHTREELGFEAKTAIICNTSGSTIQIAGTDLRVPPTVTNLVVALRPYLDHWAALVLTSASGAGELDVILTEEVFNPTGQFGVTVTVGSVTVAGGTLDSIGVLPQPKGAVHHTASVITLASGAGTLAARATRTGGVLYAKAGNTADIVVETSGFHIPPGASLAITAIDAYSFTGTTGDVLYVYEEYN